MRKLFLTIVGLSFIAIAAPVYANQTVNINGTDYVLSDTDAANLAVQAARQENSNNLSNNVQQIATYADLGKKYRVSFSKYSD
jgi:uncharacterized protein YxeA